MEAGLAGLLSGASSDDDNVAIFGVFIGAAGDLDVARGGGEGVAEIHGFAFGIFGDDIGEDDFVDGGALIK